MDFKANKVYLSPAEQSLTGWPEIIDTDTALGSRGENLLNTIRTRHVALRRFHVSTSAATEAQEAASIKEGDRMFQEDLLAMQMQRQIDLQRIIKALY